MTNDSCIARHIVRPRQGRGGADGGFSLIELTIALVVMSIVIGITVGVIVGIQQEQVNVSATNNGSRASQLASQEVIQYLRAASKLENGYPTSGSTWTETTTSLQIPAFIGIKSLTVSTPNIDTVDMTYTASGSCTPACPAGLGELQVSITGSTGTRTLASYYVLAPKTPIFQYLTYVTGTTTGATKTMNTPINTNNCLEQIVAVEVNISFLGAQSGKSLISDYAADVPSTLQTTVYLRNNFDTFGSTTTSTSSSLPGSC